MKNHWITFITGRVLVKASGRGLELLLNKCTREGIIIWKVKRLRKGGLLFFIRLTDIHNLRHAAREFDSNMSFVRGEGLPFLWKRVMKNSGFPIGILLFLILITILSNITWGIEIKGANPETEHKIRQQLDKLGIRIGTSHLFNQDTEKIQRKLTDRITNITWIGVELKGTTFHFQVVEKTEPQKEKQPVPSHIVAKKKAVISDLFIEKGKPLVKVNQFVGKGQMLVSGLIGPEEEQIKIAARGKVLGKTWYKTIVEYPLETSFQVFNGEEKRQYFIGLGPYNVLVWGFGKITFQAYESELDETYMKFLKWKLPFSITKKTVRAKEEMKRILTEEEGIEAAKHYARRDLLQYIPKEAQVDKEIILHEEVENGKVKLSVHFQVIEDIAKEIPIIQGD